ncbi:hypothetical protein TcG_09987 [Trypanosoma cruzi]|nr:hypothetical protein TcG_09987 [Trypanosoma cruzi]
MSESATPAEQCPARTVNQLQTLLMANGGTINGPSSGWTNGRSACSLTAAGTVSSARAFTCAKVKASFLQPNAPSKEFTAQRQKKPQCLLLSHEFVVDVLMRMGTHGSFQTPLRTYNASCALRCIFLTVNKINLALGAHHIVTE